MIRYSKIIIASFILLTSCTNLDERHVFKYLLFGEEGKGIKMSGRMGPGIEFSLEEVTFEDKPFMVDHEVYGNELEYFFEVKSNNPDADMHIQVFIDDILIEHDSIFDTSTTPPFLRISGIFTD